MVIDFGVKTDPKSALLILTDAAGAFIEPGAEVLVAGIETPFIMGYDGQVFLEGIAAKNNVTVKTGTAECKASFAYKPDPANIATIGPVTCQ